MRVQWSVGDGSPWRRMSQFTCVCATDSTFVSPGISYDEILIPMLMVSIGGAFVR